MPATVQATIAARIDRLDPAAKRTLSAAAVIGSQFSRDCWKHWALSPCLTTWCGPSSSIRSRSPQTRSMCSTIR